jgi:hypothetical protein
MPAIALCYWGLPRSTRTVVKSHQTHIFDELIKHGIEFDVYTHTWNETKNRVWESILETPIYPNDIQLLNPIKYQIDDQNEFKRSLNMSDYYYVQDIENEWRLPLLENHLCALESMKRVTSLMLLSGIKYDYVIFIRPDANITTSLPIQEILDYMRTPNTIILPNFDHFEGYNDRFAFMRYENTTLYSHRIDGLKEYRKHNGRIVSEKYCKYVIDKCYDNVRFVDFKFELVYNNKLTLHDVINNNTDKNTVHSYIEVYEKLFEPIRLTASRIMEIGIYEGGSIDMWSKYFLNAEIHGADIDLRYNKYSFTDPRIKLHCENAYSNSFVSIFDCQSFDVIIDDGPHTLDSMIQFVQLYPKLLKQNGLMIIEDVQSADWIPEILKHLPIELQQSVIVFDRRHIKGRYDDIQIVIRNTCMIGI